MGTGSDTLLSSYADKFCVVRVLTPRAFNLLSRG